MMDIEEVLLQILWLKKKTSDGRVRTENKISNKKLGIRWRITQINY